MAGPMPGSTAGAKKICSAIVSYKVALDARYNRLYRAGRRGKYSEASSTNIASTLFYMLQVFLLLQQQQRVQGCCVVVDAFIELLEGG